MCFLGVLRLGRVETCLFRQVTFTELFADGASRRIDRFRRHLHAVRTHIGDQTDGLAANVDALVKLLRDLHSARGREAEFGGGGLLQRGSGKGRCRVALDRFCLDAFDDIAGTFQQRLQLAGFFAIADRARLQPLAIGGNQSCLELVAARRFQERREVPVFLGNEALDLGFSIADEAQRNRLHAAGGTRAGQLAPENRREVEADEVIERAACQIGIDQRDVDVARIGHRIEHGLLGDRVEDDALDRLAVDHALLVQKVENMPGDRFAFAIRVGRQEQGIGGFHRVGNILHALGGRAVHLPKHLEILIRKN